MKASNLIVYGLLVGFAALQFAYSVRSPGFFDGETTYVELARSIIERSPYGFNFKPEIRFPPGFPLILVGISQITGLKFGAMTQVMSIFTLLGFIAVYEVLRREEGQLCGALVSLLLISSPQVFAFATQTLSPEWPYLLFTYLVLLTSRRLEDYKQTWAKTPLWICLALALVASLMVRTAAIALLAALFLWLSVSLITEKKRALPRLKTFLPILILGSLVEALWTYRGKILEVAEWPLNGYPGSYFSEVLLKRGNYAELGNASPGDILLRFGHNLIGYALGLTTILSRKDYIVPLMFSPAVILPLLLITVGVASDLMRKKGGLAEWYFISYMAMYLLWPWDYDIRFLLPAAPLACLYMWRGIKELYRMVTETPKTVGLIALPVCIVLTVFSAGEGLRIGGIQPILSLLFWLALSAIAIVVLTLWRSPSLSGAGARLKQWLFKETVWRGSLRVPNVNLVALTVAAPLIVIGCSMQTQIGRENMRFDPTNFTDVRAAQYVNLHTDRNAVIMAGHTDIVYHYTRRRVIWFPPISNPHVLMDGIRRYKVNFIIVIDRYNEYYLPPEHDCFQRLSGQYPEAFHLVYHDPRFNIYEVSNGVFGPMGHG